MADGNGRSPNQGWAVWPHRVVPVNHLAHQTHQPFIRQSTPKIVLMPFLFFSFQFSISQARESLTPI